MGETAEKLKYKGHHIRIEYDDSPTDPREWDNACKMVCQHRRYTLGDEQYSNEYAGSWKEWFAEYVMKNHKPFDNKHYDEEGYLDDAGVKKVWKWIEANMVVQAINMYDHSGISLSTSNGYPYNDRWDAGQVGFAYMTKKMIMDNFQVAGKNLTPKFEKRVKELTEQGSDFVLVKYF